MAIVAVKQMSIQIRKELLFIMESSMEGFSKGIPLRK
jgi:hypothetical protein